MTLNNGTERTRKLTCLAWSAIISSVRALGRRHVPVHFGPVDCGVFIRVEPRKKLTNESESRLWAKCSKDSLPASNHSFATTFQHFYPVASQILETIGLTAEYTIAEHAIIPLIALDYSFYLVLAIEAP